MIKRFRLQTIVLGFLILLLAGCGGGGGGGTSKGSLTLSADWSHFGNGISGQSQKWSLFDSADTFVQAVVINHDTEDIQSVPLTGLTKGAYHLRVELYSGRDLGGSVIGVIDELVQVGGLSSYTTAVGTSPATIRVTPTSATIVASHTKQFYAAAYNATNKATFVAPGSITWSTLGGVLSVDDAGIVTANATGGGSVVATHDPTSLQGAATITVTPNQATTGKWTVLVYLNAANDLDIFSPDNVNQMEQVAGNPDVRFVIQWKQVFIPFVSETPTFSGTRRYLAKQDNKTAIASELVQDMGEGVDMGDKDTLTDFINWGKTHYPADHYVLVVWNHGNGWRRSLDNNAYPTRGVSYDDETGNSIKTWELSQALGNNHFDILAWDASLMQMAEVMNEIRDQVDFIVGSEESPPGEGFPYDLVFQHFRDNPDDSTLNLAKKFVDEMMNRFPNKFITESVIDPTQLPNLMTKIDALGQQLVAAQASPGFAALIQDVRTNAAKYPRNPSSSDFRKFRDLWDVADRIKAGTSVQALKDACDDVKTAVEAAVKYENHTANESGSHGISIDFSTSTTYATFSDDYALLRFATDTSWDDWLAVAP